MWIRETVQALVNSRLFKSSKICVADELQQMYHSKNVAVHTREAEGPFMERKDEESRRGIGSAAALVSQHDFNVTFSINLPRSNAHRASGFDPQKGWKNSPGSDTTTRE